MVPLFVVLEVDQKPAAVQLTSLKQEVKVGDATPGTASTMAKVKAMC
jgi:hypothetical protein